MARPQCRASAGERALLARGGLPRPGGQARPRCRGKHHRPFGKSINETSSTCLGALRAAVPAPSTAGPTSTTRRFRTAVSEVRRRAVPDGGQLRPPEPQRHRHQLPVQGHHQPVLVGPRRRHGAPRSGVGLRLPDPPAPAHRRTGGLLQRKGRPVPRRTAARAAHDALLRVDRQPGDPMSAAAALQRWSRRSQRGSPHSSPCR